MRDADFVAPFIRELNHELRRVHALRHMSGLLGLDLPIKPGPSSVAPQVWPLGLGARSPPNLLRGVAMRPSVGGVLVALT